MATPLATDDEQELRRLERQCLDYLDRVLEQIDGFGEATYILDDDHLAELGVRKAEPLDIDEASIDFGRRFFSPRCSAEEARQKTSSYVAEDPEVIGYDGWPKRCRRGSFEYFRDPELPHDPEERHPLCTPEQCADFRLKWFLVAGGASDPSFCAEASTPGVWHGSGWKAVRFVDLRSRTSRGLTVLIAGILQPGLPETKFHAKSPEPFPIVCPGREPPGHLLLPREPGSAP
jgi:hypothetical protein